VPAHPGGARVAARLSHPSFALSPAVIQFLAQTIGANGRDIEGAIARLLVSAKLSGVPHTVESAQSAIRDLLQAHNPRRVTVEDIQNLVATHYSMTRADLLSAQKTAKVVKPRQVAMYLAKALTPRSLPEIGRRFGGRDHTTVLHAVRKIERLAGADRALSEEIELLKRGLARIGLVSSSFLKLRAMSKSHAQAC
jgi:chromosomal replication initiator protein